MNRRSFLQRLAAVVGGGAAVAVGMPEVEKEPEQIVAPHTTDLGRHHSTAVFRASAYSPFIGTAIARPSDDSML